MTTSDADGGPAGDADGRSEAAVVSTRRFGDMTLDRETGSMEGKMPWRGKSVYLCIGASESDGVSVALRVAETLHDAQDHWAREVDDYAVRKILPWYEDGWRLVEDPEMTPEEFLSRITLSSIFIDGSGRFTFYHDDGGIFSGHFVEIAGTLEAGLDHADTPG